MLLHIDESKHRSFQDDRYYELIVILDDASHAVADQGAGEGEGSSRIDCDNLRLTVANPPSTAIRAQ